MDSGTRGRAPHPTMRLVGVDRSAPHEITIAEGRTRIGSDGDNDLVIADPTVSRRHAEIQRRGARCRVTDLGSTNGTFLNGRRVTTAAIVKGGDELRFGMVRFMAHNPAARASGRRMRTRTAIEILIAMFVIGFGAMEYFLMTRSGSRSAEIGAVAPSPAAGVPIHTAASAASPEEKPRISKSFGPIPGWLQWLNHYRLDVGAPPVSADPALSAGDEAHARYLVENYGDAIKRGDRPGAEMHTESPRMPGYSEAGLKAAAASDVAQWASRGGENFNAETAIDGWMSIPFHRLPLLSPRLQRAGYGEYCRPGNCAAALNVLTGADPLHPVPVMLPHPIEFPPGGSTAALISAGLEWPDPLTSCPGYSLPTGSPITLQLGSWYQPALSAYSLRRDGVAIDACGFDANSYVNPDPTVQKTGRDGLRDYGAVVVIPREPLTAGSYDVSMTVDGKPYRWSFKVK